jgi:hypothetical protein
MSTETPRLLDTIASEARTALDDPEYYDITDQANAQALAIERLDEIIEALNPSTETREAYADTLTILGQHLAERADVIEASEVSYPEHDAATREAYEEAHTALLQALDLIDTAIESLRGESA